MTDLPFLYDLGSIVVAAAVMVLLARLVRTPSIVAYLAAGLLLGPVTGLMEATETVNLIAEIGVSLLLFLVGLTGGAEWPGGVNRRAAGLTGLRWSPVVAGPRGEAVAH